MKFCLAIVLLLLLGKSNLIAFGLTIVESRMKNISKRNTKSDIEAELKFKSGLYLVFKAISS